MYNERIENLIKAALADGVITEKERQILFRNAQEQGIDLDEFEIILDARLVELKKRRKKIPRNQISLGMFINALRVERLFLLWPYHALNADLSSQA